VSIYEQKRKTPNFNLKKEAISELEIASTIFLSKLFLVTTQLIISIQSSA